MKHQRIEVTITDGSAWLGRLSPRQMISVGDCLWSAKRKRLIQDMKDAEIDSENRMKSLESHDNKRGLMSEIIGYAVTSHGSLEIIKEASKSEHAENAEGLPDNFEGTAEDAIRIALELIGTEISMGNDKESKKKK
tara:strand:+ start:177 stop:584 length:408 start_codon:yes stop_codon:yes gene_type:complete